MTRNIKVHVYQPLRRALLAGLVALGAGVRAKASTPHTVNFDVRIPLRDGLSLSATIVRPAGSTQCPVVLTMTPYGADRYYPISVALAEVGYIGVSVDVRGRGDSDGRFEPQLNDAVDGYDVVEWLSRQPFCDGRVAMRGNSYSGLVQWQVAALRPPALKTIIPGAPPYMGFDTPMRRGVGQPEDLAWFALVAGRARNTNLGGDENYWIELDRKLASGAIAWPDFAAAAGLPTQYWKTSLKHPSMDSYWRSQNPTPADLAKITIPILNLTGMYDGAQGGTLRHYEALLAANPGAVQRTFLIIGPWSHEGVSFAQPEFGGLTFGSESRIDRFHWTAAWLDWVFERGAFPIFIKGAVTSYELGSETWRSAQSIDSAAFETFYLTMNGTISHNIAEIGRKYFTYDPTATAIDWTPVPRVVREKASC